MNEEQFIIYNTILQEIETAVEVSISNLERSVLKDLMRGLEKKPTSGRRSRTRF